MPLRDSTAFKLAVQLGAPVTKQEDGTDLVVVSEAERPALFAALTGAGVASSHGEVRLIYTGALKSRLATERLSQVPVKKEPAQAEAPPTGPPVDPDLQRRRMRQLSRPRKQKEKEEDGPADPRRLSASQVDQLAKRLTVHKRDQLPPAAEPAEPQDKAEPEPTRSLREQQHYLRRLARPREKKVEPRPEPVGAGQAKRAPVSAGEQAARMERLCAGSSTVERRPTSASDRGSAERDGTAAEQGVARTEDALPEEKRAEWERMVQDVKQREAEERLWEQYKDEVHGASDEDEYHGELDFGELDQRTGELPFPTALPEDGRLSRIEEEPDELSRSPSAPSPQATGDAGRGSSAAAGAAATPGDAAATSDAAESSAQPPRKFWTPLLAHEFVPKKASKPGAAYKAKPKIIVPKRTSPTFQEEKRACAKLAESTEELLWTLLVLRRSDKIPPGGDALFDAIGLHRMTWAKVTAALMKHSQPLPLALLKRVETELRPIYSAMFGCRVNARTVETAIALSSQVHAALHALLQKQQSSDGLTSERTPAAAAHAPDADGTRFAPDPQGTDSPRSNSAAADVPVAVAAKVADGENKENASANDNRQQSSAAS